MALGFSRSLLRALFVVSVAGAALVGTQGCIITTTDNTPPAPANGTLIVTWSIQDSTAPSACTARNAAFLRFRVFNTAGQQIGTDYEQSCTAFSTSLLLAPGRYTLQAELTDASRNARTTTVGAAPSPAVVFDVSSNFETTVPVKFPDISFK